MCSEMVRADIDVFRRDQVLKDAGFLVRNQYE
jgi:GDPmannose 4,6-dehydratase